MPVLYTTETAADSAPAHSDSAAAEGKFPGGAALRTLVNSNGERWLSYRKELTPRYGVAWLQIGVCLACVAAGLALAIAVNYRWSNAPAYAAVPLLALWMGYWLHALLLFGHEAAHFHLAKAHATNDRLANLLVLPFFGLDVRLYRKLHWQHHLHLGDPHDTEISYHNRPSIAFLLQAFTGVYPVKTLIAYHRSLSDGHGGGRGARMSARERAWGFLALLRAAAIHLTIVGTLVWEQCYAAAFAWVVSLIVFFPAFNMVRQIIEHRALNALDGVDYRRVAHGAVNRMFRSGPLSSTFGGAGFNRHLLHHWDPGVSYTRFDDMEAFLMQCATADEIDAARTSYWHTFRALFAGGHGR